METRFVFVCWLLCFLGIIFALRLFTMHGNLWLISRYVFASSFFIYTMWFVLNFHTNLIKDLKRIFWMHFAFMALFLYRGLLKFILILLINPLVFIKKSNDSQVMRILFWLLCSSFFIIQLYFLYNYHNDKWIG